MKLIYCYFQEHNIKEHVKVDNKLLINEKNNSKTKLKSKHKKENEQSLSKKRKISSIVENKNNNKIDNKKTSK